MSSAVATSPITASTELDFPTAIQALLDGRKLRRVSWPDQSVCIYIAYGLLKLRKPNGEMCDLIISDGDLQATDWIIVREN